MEQPTAKKKKDTLQKTLHIRVKDKHARVLLNLARQVNQVFNYCNELSSRAIRERQQWMSSYDLQKYTAGFSKCDDVLIGSQTVQLVCDEYATRRKQFKKTRLNWRVSNQKSTKYSLGWIPFKSKQIKYVQGQIHFAGFKFGLWDSYGLADYKICAGNFSEDSRGRWYFNAVVDVIDRADIQPSNNQKSAGIDLGLKDCATTSDGDKLHGRWYRELEKKLATAQRAGKKNRARAIHAKIKNRRADDMHKFSTQLVKENGAIFVGNVASAAMIKTKMAKSTLDAGWSKLKTMLEYKSRQAGVVFQVVNERYSTQTCSCCWVIPDSSPKGRAGLGIREWKCSNCGAVHDRDVNSARVILALGLGRLVGGSKRKSHSVCGPVTVTVQGIPGL